MQCGETEYKLECPVSPLLFLILMISITHMMHVKHMCA